MNRHLTTSLTAVAFCLLALLGACDQGEDETCQINSDCSSGLVCCTGGSGDRGYCSDRAACEGAIEEDVDSGANMTPPDEDAGDDAGGGSDGG